MCATGATHEDETSDQSRFSRKSRESRTNNEIRFTEAENEADGRGSFAAVERSMSDRLLAIMGEKTRWEKGRFI